MNDLTFESVVFVPWMENGLQDDFICSILWQPDGSPSVISRRPPDLLLAPQGTLWLTRQGENAQIVRITDAGSAENFTFEVAGVDFVRTLVPTLDGGIILFGWEGRSNVLARLSGTGDLIWRRKDVSVVPANFYNAQLRADSDGSVYLYTGDPSRPARGQVVQVDLEDGTLTAVLDFTGYAPGNLFVWEGSLIWAMYESGKYYWGSQDIETGRQNVVLVHEELQRGEALAPLPGGGALFGMGNELVWMGSDGAEVDRLALAGLVRSGDGLAVGVREGDEVVITQWDDGQATSSIRVESLEASDTMISANGGEYTFLSVGPHLAIVDSDGGVVTETLSCSLSELRSQRQGLISVAGAVVGRDGSVFLPGSDAEGAFVVRITGMPSGD